ncbi:MAG TPA: alkaline phosphatase family protein [Ohtaekwangia sp.]|nr:alkaline phosphatase family protein [Ohtaekwangia sp.]
MKWIGLLLLFYITGAAVNAQERRTKNVVLVTLDGFRWQELFNGADRDILCNKKYVSDKSVVDLFWNKETELRRQQLMPFVWNVISRQGQIYGNRRYGNEVNCTNPHWFSSPGYSEMLVGFVDPAIDSNDPVANPNRTVLDFIAANPGFHNSVAIFASWDGIAYVARMKESSLVPNAGRTPAHGKISDRERMLNHLQHLLPGRGPRPDVFTFQFALEYLKREQPRVIYISFNETDSFGHRGQYDEYLKSAHNADRMLGQLWAWIQSEDGYRDQTTMVITTDHGRGEKARRSWKRHGANIPGSDEVWIAAIGPDTPARGEMKTKATYFQKQVAGTMAAFLGLEYTNRKPVGAVIEDMIPPELITRGKGVQVNGD